MLINGKNTFEYRVVGDKWWKCPLPSSYEDMIPEKLILKNLRNDSEMHLCRNCRSEDIFTVIDTDDLVLVRKASEASNRDIVVALVEGEVTMKRLVLMDGGAILMPENKEMSPIIIDSTQLRINGVVEAVIKRD